jgi:hypothetical protein
MQVFAFGDENDGWIICDLNIVLFDTELQIVSLSQLVCSSRSPPPKEAN